MSLLWLKRISLCVVILSFWESTSRATEPYQHGNPSNLEQLLLERINATRANPGPVAQRLGVALADTSARQPFVFQAALLVASESHSLHIINTGNFSHVGAGNTNAQQRMAAAGYPFGGGYEGWAENLGLHETPGFTEEEVLHRTQDLIFKSSEHRRWLLEPFFREVGLGGEFGTMKLQGAKRQVIVITQSFAASGASPTASSAGSFLQGVVYNDSNGNRRYDLGEGVPNVTVTPSVGAYHGVTSASGGYAIPMANHQGAVTLTFSKDTLSHPITLAMTYGVNAKTDLRLQDVPEPASAVVVDPLPQPAPPTVATLNPLQIGTASTDTLFLTVLHDVPAIVQHSHDLLTWTTIETELADGASEIAIPKSTRQGYYRLAPQPQ